MNALPVERLFAQELLPTLAIPIIDAHAHLPSDVEPETQTVDTNPAKTHLSTGLKRWLQMPRVTHYPLSASRLSCDPGWPVSPPFSRPPLFCPFG